MFVDPATHSTGWAIFDGNKLMFHGTIEADDGPVSERLSSLFAFYKELALYYKPDELYIEQMNRMVSYGVVWSVGVIVAAVSAGTFGEAKGPTLGLPSHQISPSTWKAYDKRHDVYNTIRKTAASDDETVAVLLGLSWLEKNT